MSTLYLYDFLIPYPLPPLLLNPTLGWLRMKQRKASCLKDCLMLVETT